MISDSTDDVLRIIYSICLVVFTSNTSPIREYTLKVERVCALLDPRRKSLDNSQIVNGSAALRTRAEEDLKALIETFADEQTPSPAPLPASSVVNQETAEA